MRERTALCFAAAPITMDAAERNTSDPSLLPSSSIWPLPESPAQCRTSRSSSEHAVEQQPDLTSSEPSKRHVVSCSACCAHAGDGAGAAADALPARAAVSVPVAVEVPAPPVMSGANVATTSDSVLVGAWVASVQAPIHLSFGEAAARCARACSTNNCRGASQQHVLHPLKPPLAGAPLSSSGAYSCVGTGQSAPVALATTRAASKRAAGGGGAGGAAAAAGGEGGTTGAVAGSCAAARQDSSDAASAAAKMRAERRAMFTQCS